MRLPRKQDLPRGVWLVRWTDQWVRVQYPAGHFIGYNPHGYADHGLRLIWQHHHPTYAARS